jgi:hypothetical protein
MIVEQPEINCPAFQKQGPIINDITNKINRAEGILAKARFVEELLKKVNAFIFCPDYDGNKAECKHCRSVAILRKKTAEIIIKAEKLV